MTTKIAVAGGNLFRIAAEQLGDARQWWRIAQMNGLNDPNISGILSLILPTPNTNLRDGLPPS